MDEEPPGMRALEAKLTIVVPTFKRPDLLVECLASIAAQTYPHFVVLICDNSPDEEARPVVEALDDDRFVYTPRGVNIGMLNNVTLGFKAATTPYVMEVDDDDLLEPHCLQALLTPFEHHPEATIVFGDIKVIDSEGRILPHHERVRYLPSLDGLSPGIHQPFNGLAARGLVFLMAAALRRDAIDWDAVPSTAATAYDRYLGLAAARDSAAGYFVPTPVMRYRVHDRSDGLRFTVQCISGALDVLIREKEQTTPAETREMIAVEVVRTRVRLVRTLLVGGKLRQALIQTGHILTRESLPAFYLIVVRQFAPAYGRRVAAACSRLLRGLVSSRKPG